MGSHHVVLVALPGVQLLDIVGPLEAFDVANQVLAHAGRPPFYSLEVASIQRRVSTSARLEIFATPLEQVRHLDTLVIGGNLAMAERSIPKPALRSIRRLARSTRRVVSVCAGAFILGDLGLLDGRRCTTHWLALDALKARFPQARVEADSIYADDHPIYTSAGVTSGIDLALYLIERDLGPKLALAVARLLVVFLHRPGGQSQFSASLELRPSTDRRLRGLAAAVVAAPQNRWTVDVLAKRAAMSTRNFARVFTQRQGQTPAAFVERVRLDAARMKLEASDESVASVAAQAGFGTEETLRRAFLRSLGITPADYRRRFHQRRPRPPGRR
jgi:transcriptional regulator GlxA family with amidase domain